MQWLGAALTSKIFKFRAPGEAQRDRRKFLQVLVLRRQAKRHGSLLFGLRRRAYAQPAA
jgi:hypothetical protein